MKRKTILLSLLLVAALVLGMVPFSAFRTEVYAAATPIADPDVDGSKTASPTALDPEHRDTTVTLSLPSAEYQNEIDIVFVMDNSSSTMDGKAFSGHVEDLFKSILETNPNLKINVGVVKFRGYATDMLNAGLVTYTEGDNTILNAISNTIVPGNGTNIHSGLVMADDLLSKDDLPDDHKYVVLLTDGKTYIWNNEKGEPTTYYTQWYRGNKYPMQNGGKPTLSQNAGEYNKIAYPIDVLDPTGLSNIFVADPVNRGDFDLFFAIDETNERLYKELSEDTGFESYAYYAYDRTQPDGTVTPHKTTSGPAILYNKHGDYDTYFEFEPNERWAGVKYYEANPYLPAKDEDGSYYFTNQINPNYYQYHVDNQQKALFKTSHLWADMNEKYNCAAVTYWGSSDSGTTLAQSFHNWLVVNSKYGAEVSNSGQVKQMFENISNDILYMVARGTVTDPIPENFELKQTEGACPFTVETQNDGPLTAVDISENSWGFGAMTQVEGTTGPAYKYVVSYDPETKIITWEINVPVENANRISLSYTLTIDAGSATNLNPGYPTNGETVLSYTSTDGKQGAYPFEVPKVTYATKHTVSYEYTGDNIPPNAPELPDPVDYLTGEPVDVENNPTLAGFAFSGWTTDDAAVNNGSFDMPDGNVVFQGSWVEGISITVTKIWDGDEHHPDARPDTITVNLIADDEVVGTATLGEPAVVEARKEEPGMARKAGDIVLKALGREVEEEDDAWTYTFQDVPKFNDDGEKIEYTVEEPELEDYISVVTGDVDQGFTITNKYKYTDVYVMKVWDDNDDEREIRPETITVTLLADGEEVQTAEVVLENPENDEPYVRAPKREIEAKAATGTIYANAQDGDWYFTFGHLPRFDENGNEIEYSIEELVPDNYVAAITQETDTFDGETYTYWKIVNECNLTDVYAMKVWDDNDNAREVRPETITVTLLANNKEVLTEEVVPVERIPIPVEVQPALRAVTPEEENDEEQAGTIYASVVDGTWRFAFFDLPKYDEEGNAITYTLSEDVPNHYRATITQKTETFGDETITYWEIKNTYTTNTPPSPTTYTVTYMYTGDVPAGAPSVPATKSYSAGDSVPAASVPSMEGYTFSGWSGEVSTMPGHNVTVTGSWTKVEPIDDPDTPLTPPETDDETDIDDGDTPLAPPEVDDETEIDEEDTPLSPFTGDNRHTGVWAGISVAALLGIIFLGKKRKVND